MNKTLKTLALALLAFSMITIPAFADWQTDDTASVTDLQSYAIDTISGQIDGDALASAAAHGGIGQYADINVSAYSFMQSGPLMDVGNNGGGNGNITEVPDSISNFGWVTSSINIDTNGIVDLSTLNGDINQGGSGAIGTGTSSPVDTGDNGSALQETSDADYQSSNEPTANGLAHVYGYAHVYEKTDMGPGFYASGAQIENGAYVDGAGLESSSVQGSGIVSSAAHQVNAPVLSTATATSNASFDYTVNAQGAAASYSGASAQMVDGASILSAYSESNASLSDYTFTPPAP